LYGKKISLKIVQVSRLPVKNFFRSDKLSNDDERNARLHMEAFRKWLYVQKVKVGPADILAARTSLAVVGKVSSEPPVTRSANPLTKVKVGPVPDRGGRLVHLIKIVL
jgi:hypothetical protein